MKTQKFLLTILMCAPFMLASAQNTVKGTITNLRQQALEGVTVHASKSKVGTITDAKGNFTINLTDKDKTLVIYAPGVEPVKLKINPKSGEDINIGLRILPAIDTPSSPKKQGMQKDGTYYPRPNELTLSQMIEGNFPSVSYNPNGTVMIRGRVCNYYLVDGMRVPNLDVVNPTQVKSIQILKDPSQTTIYGRQATNGVVMLETM